MRDSVLIIDDENELRALLLRLFKLEGLVTFDAATGYEGLAVFDKEDISVAVVDVKLPDINGIELIHKIKEKSPLTEIILLTAFGTIEDGIRAIKEGALDYILKGDEDSKIVPLVKKAIENVRLKKRIEVLEKNAEKKFSFDSISGNSSLILNAKELALKTSQTDAPVLLLGETGTGKELFAQAIHYSGKRKSHPFVALNCSAIAKDLLESELFGYKAGAFTGAIKNKKGLFEEANMGTLFLDEIGEMDLQLQAKLLRVLETNDFIKPGDTKTTSVDVRIIAATNKNPELEIEKGNFRKDLYYRISVIRIELPSLRERKDDIKILAEQLVTDLSMKLKRKTPTVSSEFYELLTGYDFPGNIRELRNVIERALIISEGDKLDANTLPKEFFIRSSSDRSEQVRLDDMEKFHILKVLKSVNGNKTKAAELLDIGITTLYRKLQSYGLE